MNAFCASKSAAGSSSSRSAPTGSGGTASVGVSTASYGARAVRQPGGEPTHRTDREPELRAADRAPALARATGSAAAAAAPLRRHRRQRGQHRPAGLEGRHRLARHRDGDVLDLVAERRQQRDGVLPGARRTRGRPSASAITGSTNRAIRSRPGLAVAGGQERLGRRRRPRRVTRPDARRARRASRRRRARSGPGSRPWPAR